MDPRDTDPQHDFGGYPANLPEDQAPTLPRRPAEALPTTPHALPGQWQEGATQPDITPDFTPADFAAPWPQPPQLGASGASGASGNTPPYQRPPAVPTSGSPRGSRRRWVLFGGIALLLAMLIGGGVAYAMSNANSGTNPTAAMQPTSTARPKAKAIIYTVTQVTMTSSSAASTPATGTSTTPATATVIATISATDPNGNPTTITITSATVITQGKAHATLAAIVSGTRIRVAGKTHDGSILARRIAILKPNGGATSAGGNGTLPSITPVSTPSVWPLHHGCGAASEGPQAKRSPRPSRVTPIRL